MFTIKSILSYEGFTKAKGTQRNRREGSFVFRWLGTRMWFGVEMKMDEWIDGWVDGWTDGQTDGWVSGRVMVGQVRGWPRIYCSKCPRRNCFHILLAFMSSTGWTGCDKTLVWEAFFLYLSLHSSRVRYQNTRGWGFGEGEPVREAI